jgi:aspartyl-tRNA(Asn)/glutamyl-tRNA(Gln) amidotransferase subunit A
VCAAAGIGRAASRLRRRGLGAHAGGILRRVRTEAIVWAHPLSSAAEQRLISHVGPITWTVADAALMLSALAGNEDRDMWSLEAPAHDYGAALEAGIAGLRVAYSPDLGYLHVDAEVAEVVRRPCLHSQIWAAKSKK